MNCYNQIPKPAHNITRERRTAQKDPQPNETWQTESAALSQTSGDSEAYETK